MRAGVLSSHPSREREAEKGSPCRYLAFSILRLVWASWQLVESVLSSLPKLNAGYLKGERGKGEREGTLRFASSASLTSGQRRAQGCSAKRRSRVIGLKSSAKARLLAPLPTRRCWCSSLGCCRPRTSWGPSSSCRRW